MKSWHHWVREEWAKSIALAIRVTFRWRDSAHNNEQKLMTVSLDEFLRRFLLNLLAKGFVRIRNFGFLANRRRATLLPRCFQLLGAVTGGGERSWISVAVNLSSAL